MDRKPDVAHITIKLRDQQQSEIDFKVKSSTRFSRIAKAYADKKGITSEDCRFSYDGSRLLHTDDRSLADIGIENDDIIDVDLVQIGGWL
ncbi:ubiquitin-related domain-containing protein [Blastocladiella britannica]|nr:ubiquitin-related domain-containing protein [Blastocladiella britannica]